MALKIIGVVGSRTFDNYLLLTKTLDKYKDNIAVIVSGGAKGADRLAEQYAKENKIGFHEYPADWDTYGKKAGPLRNLKIVEGSDGIIAFWDGKSRGTKNTIENAKKYGKKVLIITF